MDVRFGSRFQIRVDNPRGEDKGVGAGIFGNNRLAVQSKVLKAIQAALTEAKIENKTAFPEYKWQKIGTPPQPGQPDTRPEIFYQPGFDMAVVTNTKTGDVDARKRELAAVESALLEMNGKVFTDADSANISGFFTGKVKVNTGHAWTTVKNEQADWARTGDMNLTLNLII